MKAISDKFGIQKTQIKCLFHYLPTFYHLHVHFVYAKLTDKAGAFCGKGVFLDDVIDNIEMDPSYYQKKTMLIQIGENHELFSIYQTHGLITKA